VKRAADTTNEQRRIRQLTYARLKTLTSKELKEILRDRRTVITLLVMPLLVYPLLSLAFNRLLLTGFAAAGNTTLVVGVDTDRTATEIYRLLEAGKRILGETKQSEWQEPEPNIEWRLVENVQRSVANLEIDLGIHVPPKSGDGDATRFETVRCQLYFRPSSINSATAARFVERRVDAVNERMNPGSPAIIERRHINEQDGSAPSLALFAPLVLILMTITGAVYPSIDLTAGERERGTLETLIAAPIPRIGLLFAKYIAVVTVALLTALVNLTAMTTTMMLSPAGKILFGDGSLSLLVILQIFGLLVVFAAFFSAVLLSVTSLARSFKEAQAYLIPLMLISIAPGLMGVMPGIEFNQLFAVTPLVNIVLLCRDMLEQRADPVLGTVAVLSTLIYTAAAISIASRTFGGDAVLYGSQGSWRDILGRPRLPQDTATIAGALMCLAMIFPAFFVANGVLVVLRTGIPLSAQMILAGLLNAFLFGLIPIIAAVFYKIHLQSGFRVRTPHFMHLVGAVVLGASMWPFAHEIIVWCFELFGFGSLTSDRFEQISAAIERWREIPLWIILVSLAAAPAIFEELFFRGFLFGALLKRTSPAKTIVISALLFGSFHIVSGAALTLERFLPTAFLGLMLGFVAYRSKSVFPSMLMHISNNGLLLTVAYYQNELQELGWGVGEATHMPALWLWTAAGGAMIGLVLICFGSRGVAPAAAAIDGTKSA
jgi:ABC-2 type transport system permease protein/sodium transport system permease protein